MKLLLFLGFLISLHSCNVIGVLIGNKTTEEIYDYVVNFLEGFSGKNDSKCVEVFTDVNDKENKTKIKLMGITSTIINMIKNNKTFENIMNEVGIDLIITHNLAKDCNLIEAIPLYSKIDFNKLDYIQILLDNADDLYSFFKKAPEERAKYLGEIFAKNTDFKIR